MHDPDDPVDFDDHDDPDDPGGPDDHDDLVNCPTQLIFYLNLSSRRASAQAVTSKWQLRTTSPMNTNSSAGENGILAKNGS